MAEEFLNRLDQIEEKIEGLGETLKRMITILSSATDLKSDIRQAREDVLEAINASEVPSQATESISSSEVREIVRDELKTFATSINEQIESISEQLSTSVGEIATSAPAQTAPATSAPQTEAPSDTESAMPSSLPADRSMKVAEELQKILDSLKMGCIAGDVLETMMEAKENITKIVPSDPIMVKIDKWAAIVKSYNQRHELQARDILKIKKQLREEIPKYGLS